MLETWADADHERVLALAFKVHEDACDTYAVVPAVSSNQAPSRVIDSS